MSVVHQLIPYVQRNIGNETIETVDARDLHEFLGVGKDYTNWIKVQVKRAQLIEDKDYTVYAQKGVNPSGGRPTKEYFLTFDACKHVSMICGSPKGREAREYFIDCEKALNEIREIAHHGPLVQIALQYEKLEREQNRQNQLLIEHQQKIIDTYRLAEEANAKARIAYAGTRRMTIEEFVGANDLLRQIPRSTWKAASKWLRDFCALYLNEELPEEDFPCDEPRTLSIVPQDVPGRPWKQENGYPVVALMRYAEHIQNKPRQLHLAKREEH